jgi:quercetin dioxygenase-like cupin family protein
MNWQTVASRHANLRAFRIEEVAMRKLMLILVPFLVTGGMGFAQDMRMPINANDVKWGPAPNVFPAGAQIAVVSGDPFKTGLYVVRLKFPAEYKLPAHNHPTSEYVTVLSGDFHIGMGDKLDPQKGELLRAGGFAEAPAKMNHYAWSTTETVVQVHGEGPFAITYVNPADDPSKK